MKQNESEVATDLSLDSRDYQIYIAESNYQIYRLF